MQTSRSHSDSLGKDMATLNRLHLQMLQLEDVVLRLSETQASFANGTGTADPLIHLAKFTCEGIDATIDAAIG